jgi:hypothetical protein
MTADALREKLGAEPFQPFQMRMPDGRVVAIPRPDFVSLAPTVESRSFGKVRVKDIRQWI